MADTRLDQAKAWLSLRFTKSYHITPLAGDASFRRYFRVATPEQSYILMDAPPEREDISPFIQACRWLQHTGLNVPQIMIEDKSQGFLLLQDFGDVTWSVYYKNHNHIDNLFKDALRQLHVLQQANLTRLPDFGIQRMTNEIELYLDWYLPYIKEVKPSKHARKQFIQSLTPLLQSIDRMPKVPVHLDYHSRNLMIPKHGLPLGIIDFQDMAMGPVTYDLASLLYDCYQDYPEDERQKWSKYFFAGLSSTSQMYFGDFKAWHQAVRQTSLQRHIKVLGIFTRLAFRDNKTQFLDEIPLAHKHCMDELGALGLNIPLLNV